ncbi:hypothetical protein JW835_09935 [bacterium]|nr:hypothetical protein [bacterium]
MKARIFHTGIFIVGLVYLACWNPFAPELTRSLESAGLIVTEQKSPEEVLQNFKVSYIFKDSLLYSGLLDTAFVFEYYDPEMGTSGQNITWTRDTELRTTGRLFRYFQMIDLIWHSTIYELSGEDTSRISKQFDLTLVSAETDYHVTGRAEFTLRKCWDDRWRIKRWKDESEL